jgi:hypothetical protein
MDDRCNRSEHGNTRKIEPPCAIERPENLKREGRARFIPNSVTACEYPEPIRPRPEPGIRDVSVGVGVDPVLIECFQLVPEAHVFRCAEVDTGISEVDSLKIRG